jgi:hypothetical protein
MITPEEITAVQQAIGKLALEATRIDLDAFIEVTDEVGSPQALAAGIDPRAGPSASEWAEIARLLKPFRDDALARVRRIREERG